MGMITLELGTYNAQQQQVVYTEFFQNGEKFVDICEKSSWSITEGISFGDSLKSNNLKVKIHSTPAHINEFVSYPHIKVTDGSTLIFAGYTNTLKKTFQTITEVEGDVTFNSYANSFKDFKNTTGATISWVQSDNIKICDPSDTQHSMVHILTKLITDALNSTFHVIFTLNCTYSNSKIVNYLNIENGTSYSDILTEFLSQNGLGWYLHNNTITIIDILATHSGTATLARKVESKATITDKPYNSDITLPKVKYGTVKTTGDNYIIFKVSVTNPPNGNYPQNGGGNGYYTFDGESDTRKKLSIEYKSYKFSTESRLFDNYENDLRHFVNYGDHVFYEVHNEYGLAGLDFSLKVYGKVTYMEYDQLIDPKDITLTGNETGQWNGEEKLLEYVYDRDSSVRYIKALYLYKQNDKKVYNFTSENEMSIGEVCVISGVTGTGIALVIQSKTNTLDDFGTFSYEAVEVTDTSAITFPDYYTEADALPTENGKFTFTATRTVIPYDFTGTVKDATPVRFAIYPEALYPSNMALTIGGNAVQLSQGSSTVTEGGQQRTKTENWWFYDWIPTSYQSAQIEVIATVNGQKQVVILNCQKDPSIIQYAVSDSSTIAPVSGWSNIMPATTASNPYIWVRSDSGSGWVYNCMNKPTDRQNLEITSDSNVLYKNRRSFASRSIELTASNYGYNPTSYKWHINNTAISGATSATYAYSYMESLATAFTAKVELLDANSQVLASSERIFDLIEDSTPTSHCLGSSSVMLSDDGVYQLTTDTEVVAGKTYFTRTGTGTPSDRFVYTVVANPSTAEIGTYYEKVSTYIEGDCFVYATQADGVKTSVIYAFKDIWQSLELIGTSWSYYQVCKSESLDAVFSAYNSSTKSVDVEGYTFYKQVIGKYISGVYYQVNGCIYGGAVNTSNWTLSGRGFILDATGQITVNDAVLDTCNVKNTLSFNAGAQIVHEALSTIEGTADDPVGVTVEIEASEDRWRIQDFGNLISSENTVINVAGTYAGYDITKVVKVTNVNAQYEPSTIENVGYNSAGRGPYTISPATYDGQSLIFTYINPSHWTDDVAEISVNGTLRALVGYYINGGVAGWYPIKTITVNASDTVTVYFNRHYSGRYCQITYAGRSFYDAGFYSNGIYLYDSYDWENHGLTGYESHRLHLTSGIIFDSNNQLKYRICDNFVLYSGFGQTTIDIGISYVIDSQNLIVNGQAVTGVYFCRNSASRVTLTYNDGTNNQSITMQDGYRYSVSGTIRIKGMKAGVEMMGLYPKETESYDCGYSDKRWDTGWFVTVNQSSARRLKTDITPFIGDALQTINAIDVVNFHFKHDKEKYEAGKITYDELIDYIGFIADDSPAEVAGKKHDSFITQSCIGLLLKAVQQLSQEIEELKNNRS